jgi:hypothetical protein
VLSRCFCWMTKALFRHFIYWHQQGRGEIPPSNPVGVKFFLKFSLTEPICWADKALPSGRGPDSSKPGPPAAPTAPQLPLPNGNNNNSNRKPPQTLPCRLCCTALRRWGPIGQVQQRQQQQQQQQRE